MPKNDKDKIKVYKHLLPEERDLISQLKSEGKKQYEIAEKIGRHPSTISREFKRNIPKSASKIYFPIKAQNMADLRKYKSRQKERMNNSRVRNIITSKIRLGWTPEQIAGHIKKQRNCLRTNHESIYMYIYSEARELIQFLARGHNKREKRFQKQGKRMNKIPNRIMIDQRPQVINDRKRPGDWEADTIVSRQSKHALVVLRERKYQKVLIKKISSKTSENFNKAIISMLKNIPEKMRKSITFDNGLENAGHEKIARALNLNTYFCNPYHSWEKGSVENTNGLIRRFLPKKTDFSLIPYAKIRYIENLLNERPRKSLKFRTPNQVFLNCTS